MARNVKIEDTTLVKGLKKGDESCFDELFIRYSAAIFKVCCHYHLSQMESEGVVQDVFLKIWENRKTLDASRSFKSYLYTIAKNIILKIIRKNTLHTAFRNYIKENTHEGESATHEQICYKELEAYSNQMMNRLSPQRRQVFIMSRFDNFSNDEIAAMLKLSKRTVEHHLYHAQKFLREYMQSVKLSMVLIFMLFV